jgi:hypothetical protein
MMRFSNKIINSQPGIANFVRFLIVAFVTLLLAPSASAQDDREFSLSLGVFIHDRASVTQVGVSGETEAGTPVDLERDLGLNSSDTVFRLDGYYRFNAKHRIDFSAFDLSRTSRTVIDTEILWNGNFYPINTTIDTEIEFDVYKLAYTWAFMRRDKSYLGLTGGLYVADIGLRLSSINFGDKDGGGTTAPLPVIGLRGEYQLSEKWSIRASGEIFGLEYNEFDGLLTDFYAGIDYQIFKHAAIGVGINSVKIDLEITDNALNSELDWRYDGGLIFLKLDF